jgi:3-oxoacyl-[acyl-carrier-protein] synthase II
MTKTSPAKQRRVVVTGLGVVSSLGIGWPEFWKNLLAGKSGISKIEAFDTSGYDRYYGGEVKNFDPSKFISKHKIPQMGRASQMAVAASKLALEDAKLSKEIIIKNNMGVAAGTTMGEPKILENLYVKSTSSKKSATDTMSALIYSPHSITLNVSREFLLNSNNLLFGNACSAGNYALGYAFDLIRTGEVDLMLAGGADALSLVAFTGFHRLLAMAPEKCQPFDKNRKGMLLGEGCGMLVLENLDSALKRKAKIYAEILSYGLSCDAVNMTASSYVQISKATKKALEYADIKSDEIDYISAHGTGTPENDREECLSIKSIFGKRSNKVPVNSIKSMLGHTMGAASALEAIACCLTIKDQIIPPTINFETKDPECDIDCVPNQCRKSKVSLALNNSQAFGGNNASLIIQRY